MAQQHAPGKSFSMETVPQPRPAPKRPPVYEGYTRDVWDDMEEADFLGMTSEDVNPNEGSK